MKYQSTGDGRARPQCAPPMNKQLPFTRKMFGLEAIGEGCVYPRISDTPQGDTVGDALVKLQRQGYQLRYIAQPWQITCYHGDSESSRAFHLRDVILPGDVEEITPDSDVMCYKLRFLFILARDYIPSVEFNGTAWEWTEPRLEQEFVKGGFLYDAPEQLDEWLREGAQ